MLPLKFLFIRRPPERPPRLIVTAFLPLGKGPEQGEFSAEDDLRRPDAHNTRKDRQGAAET